MCFTVILCIFQLFAVESWIRSWSEYLVTLNIVSLYNMDRFEDDRVNLENPETQATVQGHGVPFIRVGRGTGIHP